MSLEKSKNATFWLPSSSLKNQGIFEESGDRSISVTISGSNPSDFSIFKHIYPIVLGKTFDGQDFSLFDCFLRHSESNQEGNFLIQFGANLMVKGSHGTSKSDFKFNRVIFSFLGIEKWLNPIVGKPIIDRGNKVEVVTTWPIGLKVNTNEYNLSIDQYPTYNQGDYPTVEWNAYVSLKYFAEKEFDELIKTIWCIKRFFEFAIEDVVLFTSVEAKCGEQTVELIFRNDKPHSDAQDFSRHHMLLPYFKISDEFESIMQKWIDLYSKKQNFLSRYMKHLDHPDIYDEELFFTAASLIEMYHNQFISNDRERYIDHFVLINHEFESFGCTILSRDEIERIENHRHYMAHGSREREGDLLSATEMVIYVDKIKTILKVLILKHLGLDEIARHTAQSSSVFPLS